MDQVCSDVAKLVFTVALYFTIFAKVRLSFPGTRMQSWGKVHPVKISAGNASVKGTRTLPGKGGKLGPPGVNVYLKNTDKFICL